MSDPGIWKGEMDASAGGLIITDVRAGSLVIDHTSNLLFWLNIDNSHDVFYSDLAGNNVRSAIRASNTVRRILVVGNRLWVSFYWGRDNERYGILSCDKKTGDNLKMQQLGIFEATDQRMNFLVISEPAKAQTKKQTCARKGVCSHMCIPAASGYMRCSCPTGYMLKPDGWNCGTRLPHQVSLCNFKLYLETPAGRNLEFGLSSLV